MVLKLDPGVPLVWRTPTTVQFGVDRPLVRLDDVDAIDEHLLHALSLGTPRAALDAIASFSGGDARRVDALLQLVAPALEHRRPLPRRPTLAVTGTGEVAGHVTAVLGASGFDMLADGTPELAVLVADHTVHPAQFLPWLADDIPHLPIVFGDAGATIGPLVQPGTTPCLHCAHAHRADDDPAWAAIAAQLSGRNAGERTHRLAAHAAIAAVELVEGDWSAAGRIAIRIDFDGARTEEPRDFHPDCGCRSLQTIPQPLNGADAARSRRETGTATGPGRPSPPTSADAAGAALG